MESKWHKRAIKEYSPIFKWQCHLSSNGCKELAQEAAAAIWSEKTKMELEIFLTKDDEANVPTFNISYYGKWISSRIFIFSRIVYTVLVIPISMAASKSALVIHVSMVASKYAFSINDHVLTRFKTTVTLKSMQSLVCTKDKFQVSMSSTITSVKED